MRPATPASPSVIQANEEGRQHKPRNLDVPRPERHQVVSEDGDAPAPADDDSEAMAAVMRIFKQKLADLRGLPKWQKQAGLRAAREWLAIAMKDLREKRAYRRHLLRQVGQWRNMQRNGPQS
jgi:hypothetical protein